MGLISVLAEAVSIGVVSYGVGLIPLVVKSQSHFSTLCTLGNGRLIGYALYIMLTKFADGVASTKFKLQRSGLTGTALGLSDVGGICVMWIMNRRLSSRIDASYRPTPKSEISEGSPSVAFGSVDNDIELEEREKTEGWVAESPVTAATPQSPPGSRRTLAQIGPHHQRIYLFTLVLFIQVFSEGTSNGYRATELFPFRKLPVAAGVPNFYLLVSYFHSLFDKALMAFALSTTLRSASFPITRCKQHLIAVAAAPVMAEIFSYTVITILKISAAQVSLPPWFALRSFADGMFIYAIFNLRPLLTESGAKNGWRIRHLCTTFPLMVVGAVLPWIGTIVVLYPVAMTCKSCKRPL